MTSPGVSATDSGGQASTGGTPQINLADAITPDALRRVGGDAEGSSHLRNHLPLSGEGVVPILTSPQFRQVGGTGIYWHGVPLHTTPTHVLSLFSVAGLVRDCPPVGPAGTSHDPVWAAAADGAGCRHRQ